MSRNQQFWLIFTPILFICLWITIGVVNSVVHPDATPQDDEVYRTACLQKGGIPNTRTTSEHWSCENVTKP